MVPADSRRIPRAPRYSGYRYASSRFVYGPVTLYNIGGLGYSPFARHYWGNHCLFSFPAGTKMFQFPALASRVAGCHPFRMTGCPIRKSADQRSFAPTRSLSQLITSFIASESQGLREPRHPPCALSCFFAVSVQSLAAQDSIYFQL